ncbi:MAG: hypothetical protein LDL39_04815 [Magnetospirillum sp.]|nr:hypothetical protein [Magnetospirillum sp.]
MSKYFLSLLLLPCLAGCAVVDLAAHGVKQYEKSKQPAAAESGNTNAQPTAAPAADVAQVAEPEPVSAAPEPTGTIRAQSLD